MVGRDLFTDDLLQTLLQFEQAKNFGSLIQPKLKDVAELRRAIAEKQFENLFLRDVHERVQLCCAWPSYLARIPCGGGQPALYGRREHGFAAEEVGRNLLPC